MARITPYQQQQLASNIVGAPGVNMAQANMLGAIGNDLGNIGAYQHQQALVLQRQKQAEVDAQQKKLDEMSKKTNVISVMADAGIQVQNKVNALRQQYYQQPEKAVPEFSQYMTDQTQATLQQVQDPEMKMMLQEKLTELHKNTLNELGNWQQARQVPLAEQHLASGASGLAQQAGMMGSSTPSQIKAMIDKYKVDTAQEYQFYHKQGLEGQHVASSDAVEQYLDTFANAGDPKSLEVAASQFADGKYIDQDKLSSVLSRQRSLAANQRAAIALEQTKQQHAGNLQTFQQLEAISPDGDISKINPVVARSIVKQNAKNLTPEMQKSYYSQIDHYTVEQKSALAQSEATNIALDSSSYGDIQHATPEALKRALNTPGLSTEDKQYFQRKLTENQAKGKSIENDKVVASIVGAHASGLDRLHNIINKQLLSGDLSDKAIHDVEINLDRYHKSFQQLSILQGAIQDPKVKELVKLQKVSSGAKLNQLIGSLQMLPESLAQKAAMDNLASGSQPQTIYSDSRTQQAYNYFHTLAFYNVIQTHNWGTKQINQILKNPQALNAFKNTLHKDTMRYLNNYHFGG